MDIFIPWEYVFLELKVIILFYGNLNTPLIDVFINSLLEIDEREIGCPTYAFSG